LHSFRGERSEAGSPASQPANHRRYHPASRPACAVSILIISHKDNSLLRAPHDKGVQSHSFSPHLSIAISVNQDSSLSASFTTPPPGICNVSAGSGCGSESRKETILGFAELGEKALEVALMGRGIGMGIGEALMVVVRVRMVVSRRVGACIVVCAWVWCYSL